MSNENSYYRKYLKYKQKYLELKGGGPLYESIISKKTNEEVGVFGDLIKDMKCYKTTNDKQVIVCMKENSGDELVDYFPSFKKKNIINDTEFNLLCKGPENYCTIYLLYYFNTNGEFYNTINNIRNKIFKSTITDNQKNNLGLKNPHLTFTTLYCNYGDRDKVIETLDKNKINIRKKFEELFLNKNFKLECNNEYSILTGGLPNCPTNFVGSPFTLDFTVNNPNIFNKSINDLKFYIEKLIFNSLIKTDDLSNLSRGYMNKTDKTDNDFSYFKNDNDFLLYLPKFSLGDIELHSTISNLLVGSFDIPANKFTNLEKLLGAPWQKNRLGNAIKAMDILTIIKRFKDYKINQGSKKEPITNRLKISITKENDKKNPYDMDFF